MLFYKQNIWSIRKMFCLEHGFGHESICLRGDWRYFPREYFKQCNLTIRKNDSANGCSIIAFRRDFANRSHKMVLQVIWYWVSNITWEENGCFSTANMRLYQKRFIYISRFNGWNTNYSCIFYRKPGIWLILVKDKILLDISQL